MYIYIYVYIYIYILYAKKYAYIYIYIYIYIYTYMSLLLSSLFLSIYLFCVLCTNRCQDASVPFRSVGKKSSCAQTRSHRETNQIYPSILVRFFFLIFSNVMIDKTNVLTETLKRRASCKGEAEEQDPSWRDMT